MTVVAEMSVLSSTTRGFSTLFEQVSDLRAFSANPRQRVRVGIESIDYLTDGPAAGEVYTVMGRSFSGKSNVAVNIMANNPTTPMIFFSLEMPARQALQRLYSVAENMDHRTVLEQTKRGSLPSQLDDLPDMYPYHAIIDRSGLTLGDMSAYLAQYDAYFSQRPMAVIIDYLELIQGEAGEGHFRTEVTAKKLKDWSKDEDVAVFLLHQTNRSEPVWEPPTEDSARGAGYTESDVVVGMWQPVRDPKLGDVERVSLDGIIRMNVLKNRITGRTTGGKMIELRLTPSLRLVDEAYEQVKRYYR